MHKKGEKLARLRRGEGGINYSNPAINTQSNIPARDIAVSLNRELKRDTSFREYYSASETAANRLNQLVAQLNTLVGAGVTISKDVIKSSMFNLGFLNSDRSYSRLPKVLYGGNIEVFDLETVVNELHKLYSEKVGTEVVENFSGVSEVSEQEVLDWQNVVGRDIGQVHPRTTQGIKIKQENSRERIGELSTKIKDIVAGMVEADKMYVNNILPRGEQDLIAVLTKTQGWTLLQFIQEVKTQRGKYRLDLSPEEEENPQIQKVFEESFREYKDNISEYTNNMISARREVELAADEFLGKFKLQLESSNSLHVIENLPLAFSNLEEFRFALKEAGLRDEDFNSQGLQILIEHKKKEVEKEMGRLKNERVTFLQRKKAETVSRLAGLKADVDAAVTAVDNMPLFTPRGTKPLLVGELKSSRERFVGEMRRVEQDEAEIFAELPSDLITLYNNLNQPPQARRVDLAAERAREFRDKAVVYLNYRRNDAQKEFLQQAGDIEGRGVRNWADKVALYWKSVPPVYKIIGTFSLGVASAMTGTGPFMGLAKLITSSTLTSGISALGLSSATATGVSTAISAGSIAGLSGGILEAKADQAILGNNRKKGGEALVHYGKKVGSQVGKGALFGGLGGLAGSWLSRLTGIGGQRANLLGGSGGPAGAGTRSVLLPGQSLPVLDDGFGWPLDRGGNPNTQTHNWTVNENRRGEFNQYGNNINHFMGNTWSGVVTMYGPGNFSSNALQNLAYNVHNRFAGEILQQYILDLRTQNMMNGNIRAAIRELQEHIRLRRPVTGDEWFWHVIPDNFNATNVMNKIKGLVESKEVRIGGRMQTLLSYARTK